MRSIIQDKPTEAVGEALRIQRQFPDEERRRIEERTGPLKAELAGPPTAVVSESDRNTLIPHLRPEIDAWLTATQFAVSDSVDDHQHEPDCMRRAYNNVAVNRKNSSPAIVGNFLLSAPPSLASSTERLRAALTGSSFTHVAGNAVDPEATKNAARSRLGRAWDLIERRRVYRKRRRVRGQVGQGSGHFPKRHPGNK